jgi:HlyD family secretion protein
VNQGEADLEAAQATLEVVRTQLAETRVLSPLDGVVLLRLVEEGEVVQPGQPLLIVIDPQELFLKVYVSEEDIGKVRLGSPVRVKVDGFPGRAFEGFVSEVAQRAEFTPRDIHMPEERTQLVFAVKVRIRETEGILKPGMLADAEIHWKEKGAVSVGNGSRPSPRREALR